MSDFRKSSAKPTWLYSNYEIINTITDFAPLDTKGQVVSTIEMTKVKTKADGSKVVSGGKDLKKSQSYTRAFGEAFADLCEDTEAHRNKIRKKHHMWVNSMDTPPVGITVSSGSSWADSSMNDALNFMIA